MKKTFVFDKLENDLVNIDESTVLAETGVDAARVKKLVMKEIRGEKKTKRAPIRRIFSIIAVAAVITAAATVTVQAATGGFKSIFGSLFAGESVNGIYPGADLTIESETLNIDFIGITGDETSMMAVYDIRKNDGGNFLDDYDPETDYRFLSVRADMDVTENAYIEFIYDMFGGGRGGGYGVIYELIDEKTLRAYAAYSDSLGGIKGQRLTVWDSETTVYRIDEIFYSCIVGVDKGVVEFMENNPDFIDKKRASFTEDQTIVVITEDPELLLAAATQTTIPLDYKLGVTLNYKSVEKTFHQANGNNFSALNSEWTVKNIRAGAFEMTIDAETSHLGLYEAYGIDVGNSANWSPEEWHKYHNVPTEIDVEITLKDGTKIHTSASASSTQGEADGKNESSWRFNYFKEGEENKPYSLDPNNIASITCCGTELLR